MIAYLNRIKLEFFFHLSIVGMFLVVSVREAAVKNGSSGKIRELGDPMCQPYGLWLGPTLFRGLSYKSRFRLDQVQFVSLLFVCFYLKVMLCFSSLLTTQAGLQKAVLNSLLF